MTTGIQLITVRIHLKRNEIIPTNNSQQGRMFKYDSKRIPFSYQYDTVIIWRLTRSLVGAKKPEIWKENGERYGLNKYIEPNAY